MPTKEIVYVGTGGLTSNSRTIYAESNENNVADGRAYSLGFDYDSYSNDYLLDTAQLTTSNYGGLFLTPQFILNYLVEDGAIPDEATEIEFYDFSGQYNNTGSNQYNRTVTRDRIGAATFNGINGVVVLFPSGDGLIGNNSNYRSWKFNLPITLRYTTTFGESGLPILPLN